jgi:hypothetical protein
MKNPFKPEHSAQNRDNPVVPNVVERPVERAADRAASHDNPLVPNAIERPVERAVAGDRTPVTSSAGVADHPHFDHSGDVPGMVAHQSDRHQPDMPRDAADSPHSNTAMRQIDLFPTEELVGYRTRWDAVQTGFVDEPRAAVEQADALVSQVVNRLTEVFSRERSTLENQWAKGDDVSTEDLRIALTRYRSFFNRLLSM